MAAMARLNMIWRCNTISFASKHKVYKSLVTSILLYGCETWTLLADPKTKDPGFRNQVHEETSPYLLLGLQEQCTTFGEKGIAEAYSNRNNLG